MKCKGKCFDRQSGETGAISPEKVAGMDQRLLWREQLGRDSKSLENFKLGVLSPFYPRLWASRLVLRKNFSTDQMMK